MGFLLQQVSGAVLVWVVMLVRVNCVADAERVSGPFVDLGSESLIGPDCAMTSWYLGQPPRMPYRCLYPFPIKFKENATGPVFSFSTKFTAWMLQGAPLPRQVGYGGFGRNNMEGFTFALLPHPNASLDSDGGYLGLLNATSNGDPQAHTFAVEFDFVKSPEFSDPDDGFHIGIDVNSMNSISWVPLQGPRNFSFPVWTLQVWIDYDAPTQTLNVSSANIGDLSCPLTDEERPGPTVLSLNETTMVTYDSLSQKVDLSTVLNEYMYVGFTSNMAKSLDLTVFEMPALEVYKWSLRTSDSASPVLPSAPLPCFISPNLSWFQLHVFETQLSAILVSLTVISAIYALMYACYSRWVERRGWRFKIDPDELGDAEPHKFTYKELAMATKNFDPKQALGRGGFGSVYKGFLPGNKQYVAVKRVAPESSQGEREFLAEVMIIGKIRHRNLVRLQGWCHERGELLLVYDYMPQGSLDKHLFGSSVAILGGLQNARGHDGVGESVVNEKEVVRFPWERRFKVMVDVARALVYLHTECEERIIHRDVKAANVMLDAKFNARLGDFGLARSYNHSLLTPESTNVAGTFGYFAPELFHTGKQTEQTDVFSFGAFLLEVACGKKPIYHDEGEVKLLVEQVWLMWGSSHILDAVDVQLLGIFDAHEMTKVLCLGLLCSHPSPTMRPSMRQVLLILNDDIDLPKVPPSKPQFDYIPRSVPDDLSWASNASSMHYTASARGESK